MTGLTKTEEWWDAVVMVAGMIMRGELLSSEERVITFELNKRSFSRDAIKSAIDWIEHASLGGRLADVFGMLQPEMKGPRLGNPIEQICVSDKLWRMIENYRVRGILSPDLTERLLEGMRSLDTRDWEDDEVIQFITDVMSSTCPSVDQKHYGNLLSGRTAGLYH